MQLVTDGRRGEDVSYDVKEAGNAPFSASKMVNIFHPNFTLPGVSPEDPTRLMGSQIERTFAAYTRGVGAEKSRRRVYLLRLAKFLTACFLSSAYPRSSHITLHLPLSQRVYSYIPSRTF
jgi:hypothetical protein